MKISIAMLLLLLAAALPVSAKTPSEADVGTSTPTKRSGPYHGTPPKPILTASRVTGPHQRHVFEPALQGDVVQHDFMVPNDTDRILEILKVSGCSGCVVESFTREIRPGREGGIAITFLTDSRGGKTIQGTLVVETNRAHEPKIEIEFSLEVEEFAVIDPYRVWLRGKAGEPIVATCRVTLNDRHPFTIKEIKPRKGVWFRHEYTQVEEGGKRAYEITLTNTRSKPGPYQDILFVQTDDPRRPEFKIRVEGRIEE